MKQLFFLSFILLLFSCSIDRPEQFVKIQGEAQGTYYMVSYYHPDGANLKKEIDSILSAFDLSVSIYHPGSIISAINNNDTSAKPDGVFTDILNKSIQVSSATDGCFDFTVGPLVNAWGFGFKEKIALTNKMVDSIKEFVDYRKVSLSGTKILKEDPRIQIDFNAIAQGYSVDLVGKYLESKGIYNYIVDIGGEVYAHGTKENGNRWRVGIEKPSNNAYDERELKAVVELENAALATSGSYRKFYVKEGVRYSHTIDPKSGFPVQHSLLSVSVKANTCCLADAYATAFMVMGVEKSMQFLETRNDIDAYFIFEGEDSFLKTMATKGMREYIISEE